MISYYHLHCQYRVFSSLVDLYNKHPLLTGSTDIECWTLQVLSFPIDYALYDMHVARSVLMRPTRTKIKATSSFSYSHSTHKVMHRNPFENFHNYHDIRASNTYNSTHHLKSLSCGRSKVDQTLQPKNPRTTCYTLHNV